MSTSTLRTVSGTSYYDETAKKIYAGVAGDVTTYCSGADSGSTCDTCKDTTGGGLKPCNQKSIHPAMTISFTFQNSVDLTGKSIALFIGDSNGSAVEISGTRTTGAAASADMTLSTTWSEYCNAVGVTGCDPSALSSGDYSTTKSFYIWADENGNSSADAETEKLQVTTSFHAISSAVTTYHIQDFGGGAVNYGLYSYSLFPGDQKMVIMDSPEPLVTTNRPTGSPDYEGVVFFAYPQAAGISTAVSNGQGILISKNFVSGSDLNIASDPYLNGLENYTRYCVFAGQRNLAQNIFAFTANNADANQMCAETSEVVGLLDDKSCFISTVAFGSNMAKEVQIFRKFRNEFLMHNSAGAAFVKAYYQYGPIAADWISQHESIKTLTRWTLYPMAGWAWLTLTYGIEVGFLTLGLFLVGLFYFRQKMGSLFFRKSWK